MDNYVKSGHLYCAMGPHRLTTRYRICNPHIHPYFKKYFGDAAVYNPNAFVCKNCHGKVMKLQKQVILPTPGSRQYFQNGPGLMQERMDDTQQNDGEQEMSHVNLRTEGEEGSLLADSDSWHSALQSQPSSMAHSFRSAVMSQESDMTIGSWHSAEQSQFSVTQSSLSVHSQSSFVVSRPQESQDSMIFTQSHLRRQTPLSIVNSLANRLPSTPQLELDSENWDSQSFSISISDSESQGQSESSSCSIQSITYDVSKIKVCLSTESKCFICGENKEKSSRCKIAKAAIRDIWRTHHILVPMSNRCCRKHRTETAFLEDAKTTINSIKTTARLSEHSLFDWLREITSAEDQPIPSCYDFEAGVTDDSYDLLVGMSKEQFDMVYSVIKPHMRCSENRTVRNALGMFLCMLHHNQTQEVIAYNFKTSQRVVSEAIDSVSEQLSLHFVPLYLGFQHVIDGDLVKYHNRETVMKALSISDDSIVLICDGTYAYIEKPSDAEEQRVTYNGQKKRNFLRFMMCVLPWGYIASAAGPFKAIDNDAVVLNHLLDDEFLEFLGPGGHLVLDRGFKQVEQIAIDKGLNVHSPEWLEKNEKQFSCIQANRSRLVTMCRWPVEATNGRLKQKFKFFLHMIPGGYSAKIEKFFMIACALLNYVSPVAFNETERHVRFAAEAAEEAETPNNLKVFLEERKLIRSTVTWRRANADILADFPKVDSLSEIEDLCRGFYNIKQAQRYIKEQLNENGDFEIRLHKDYDFLIRAQIHSRFSSSTLHSCWIKYDNEKSGRSAISGFYCTCRTGARTVTSCSHSTAVLRYMMFERHQTVQRRQVRRMNLIQCVPLPRLNAMSVDSQDE